MNFNIAAGELEVESMKYIQIKEAINLVQSNTEESCSFYTYISQIVFNDAGLGLGYDAIEHDVPIENKFKEAKVGDWVELEDSDWKRINDTIRNPKGSTPRDVLRQFLPFMRAVCKEVRDKKPESDSQ